MVSRFHHLMACVVYTTLEDLRNTSKGITYRQDPVINHGLVVARPTSNIVQYGCEPDMYYFFRTSTEEYWLELCPLLPPQESKPFRLSNPQCSLKTLSQMKETIEEIVVYSESQESISGLFFIYIAAEDDKLEVDFLSNRLASYLMCS